MTKDRIAFEAFSGDKAGLIKFGRVASSLFISNDGDNPFKVQWGVRGKYFNDYMLHPGEIFDERLDPFTEINISAPNGRISFHGWPRRNP